MWIDDNVENAFDLCGTPVFGAPQNDETVAERIFLRHQVRAKVGDPPTNKSLLRNVDPRQLGLLRLPDPKKFRCLGLEVRLEGYFIRILRFIRSHGIRRQRPFSYWAKSEAKRVYHDSEVLGQIMYEGV